MSTVRFADLLQPGDVIEVAYWGKARILARQPSGNRLAKLEWEPLEGRVVNPPGIDYVRNDSMYEVLA